MWRIYKICLRGAGSAQHRRSGAELIPYGLPFHPSSDLQGWGELFLRRGKIYGTKTRRGSNASRTGRRPHAAYLDDALAEEPMAFCIGGAELKSTQAAQAAGRMRRI